MTFARPLFFLLLLLLLVAGVPTMSMAADSVDAAKQQTSVGSLQNQVGDPGVFGAPAEDLRSSSGLFFLKDKPRLTFTTPVRQPRSAVLNDADCYTMRMYKVKRKEHFANGENGLKGYSTCEAAKNYEFRSARSACANAAGTDVLVPRRPTKTGKGASLLVPICGLADVTRTSTPPPAKF